MYMLQLQLKNIVYIYIHTPTDLMVKHNPSLHKTLWPCQSSWLYMYMPPRKLSKSSFSNLPFHLFAPCSTCELKFSKKTIRAINNIYTHKQTSNNHIFMWHADRSYAWLDRQPFSHGITKLFTLCASKEIPIIC